MEPTDRLIRSLYALALELEDEWERFRPLALEQTCHGLGAAVGAWLTQVGGRAGPGEYTLYPESAGLGSAPLQALSFGDGNTLTLSGASALPGTRHGVAVRYGHHDSRLVSTVVFGFGASSAPAPAPPDLQRITTHMVEAGGLAMRQFIQRDERLHRMGRSNRGAAAVIDAGGTLYAASRRFRDLVGGELGRPDMEQLPFALPEEAFSESGSFTNTGMRFRVARLRGGLYQLYARKSLPLDDLSPREQEIARALGAGKTFKSVARQCGIAVSTVANHASRIYRKLGVYRREDLVELVRAPGRRAATTPR